MEGYELIRSGRKTLALEITRDCRVLVRAPRTVSQAAIDAFVAKHEAWIARHLEDQRRRTAASPPAPTPAEIEALKARARAVLPPKIAFWSQRMGVAPTGLKITTARKRWGSCSGKNSLCFSCFLMANPEDAIDYVIVHELAHIRHKNHGPDFWAAVGEVLPDYQQRRRRLSMPPVGPPR